MQRRRLINTKATIEKECGLCIYEMEYKYYEDKKTERNMSHQDSFAAD